MGKQEVSRLRRYLPDVIAKFQARSVNGVDGSTPMVEHKMHVQAHPLLTLGSISVSLASDNTSNH